MIIFSGIFAIIIDFVEFSPMRALNWSAVISGLLAPFLLLGILWVLLDKKLMRNQSGSHTSKILIALTTIFMFGAAAVRFIYQ